MKAESEYHADIQFVLQKPTDWAPAGFVIASNQLTIKPASSGKKSKSSVASLKLQRSDKDFTVIAGQTKLVVGNTGRGGLLSLQYKGKELLEQPLLPDFTRPLTDNDRRGWKPQRKLKQWYEAVPQLVKTVATESKQEIRIIAEYTMLADSARLAIWYTISPDGIVKLDYFLKADPALPNIPKIGMQMATRKEYRQIEYFGRGPLENYIDRRYGLDAGRYGQDIRDFIEPYAVPQENGNRTDVRWMFLHDTKSKEGLLIVADSLLSMSAWPYTEENLSKAKHTNELKDAGYVTVNVDLIQMGVGGNDSWSEVAAPLEQYQIKAGSYHYSFYLVPLNGKIKSPEVRARELRD